LPVADDDLAALAKLQNLEQFDFVADRQLTGVGVRYLRALPLADLRMSLNRVGEGVFDQIVSEVADFSRLNRLRLADENTLSANVLAGLSRLPRLTHLDLHQFGVENGAGTIEGLADCAHLSDLDLTWYQIKTGDLNQILRIPNLKRLDLSDVEGWRTDPRNIARIEGLEELTLSSPGPPWGRLADGCLAGFTTLTKLKRLSLSRNSISDVGLEYLPQLKNLEQLGLAHTRVTDRGLFNLARLNHLAELDLFNTAITDEGLKELQKLAELRSLDLGMTQITDVGLKYLEHSTHLRRLNLQANSITDMGLKSLATIDSLEELDLSCTEITDAGLAELKRFKHLRTLNLIRTAISDAGLKELKDLPALATLSLGR
jgi:Leucine-rich repeat (LRR) protein